MMKIQQVFNIISYKNNRKSYNLNSFRKKEKKRRKNEPRATQRKRNETRGSMAITEYNVQVARTLKIKKNFKTSSSSSLFRRTGEKEENMKIWLTTS